MAPLKYPIGTQTFEKIIEGGCVYVDKTRFVYDLAKSGVTHVFLSRPRRFGKSLFVSTLESYFEGRKELFEGLALGEQEKEWESYPVLRFDFSGLMADDSIKLEEAIHSELGRYERKFDVEINDGISSIGTRFGMLIHNVAERTGKRVVVLIDEYDKVIVDILHDEKKLENNTSLFRAFYSQLKAQDQYLRFSFLTGVARFHHLTLFSGLNNLKDISLDPRYADICGMTEAELERDFRPGIENLAKSLGVSYTDALEMLRLKYDGYRFTSADSLVYNPFSILNCLDDCMLGNYWLSTGTPKVFMTYLGKSNFDITQIEDIWADADTLSSLFGEGDPIPLLYQTGYLTIKDFKRGLYRLGIPNGEVRSALLDYLMPKFMGVKTNSEKNRLLLKLMDKTEEGDADGIVRLLQELISKIPYHEFEWDNVEKTYHLIVYIISLMAGIDSKCEMATAGGRVDMVMRSPEYVYVFEFKLDHSPAEALRQIDEKGYAIPWRSDGRKVFKIGVEFSSANRNISDWIVLEE